jgi:hypothetical protein
MCVPCVCCRAPGQREYFAYGTRTETARCRSGHGHCVSGGRCVRRQACKMTPSDRARRCVDPHVSRRRARCGDSGASRARDGDHDGESCFQSGHGRIGMVCRVAVAPVPGVPSDQRVPCPGRWRVRMLYADGVRLAGGVGRMAPSARTSWGRSAAERSLTGARAERAAPVTRMRSHPR